MKRSILILLGLAVLFLQPASAGNWQIITSPNGSRQVNELHSVSALAENDVWAVGVSYNIERTLGSTLIEHWNGSRWSVVPSPNPSGTTWRLSGPSATRTGATMPQPRLPFGPGTSTADSSSSAPDSRTR